MTKAIALVIFPLVLLILPATFFDNGGPMCLFTLLSGYECWGCGLTRACMHLIHLDGAKALAYNKISFVVLPILSILLLKEFIATVKQYRSAAPGNNEAVDNI
jgi:hypothetical protein